GNFGDIAVGPNGQVVVTYQDPAGVTPPATIFVHTDPDGLGPQPFAPRVAATPTNVQGFRNIPAQPNRSVDAEATLAFDRSGGAFNGRLYLAYTDAPTTTSNDTNIFVRVSDNNGATWSAPVLVHEVNTNSQFLPGMAVDQTTGNLAVGWYDARNSAANTTAQYCVPA